eukprot:538055_1
MAASLQLIIIRWFIYGLSISLYFYCGITKNLIFPWFIGDTFEELQNSMDLYDGSEIFITFAWLIVFIAISYFVYLDTKILWHSILYFCCFYQYIIIISIEEYYHNFEYLFINRINYLSVILILIINGYIFGKNKFLLPRSSVCFNTLISHSVIIVYVILFGYEHIVHSKSILSKITQIIMFYASLLFIIKPKPIIEQIDEETASQMEQNAKIDEILYSMTIEARNEAMIHESSDESSSDDFSRSIYML